MKSNARIIVGRACNYTCSYCCNKLPGMMQQFYPIDSSSELYWVIYSHDNICISGGEPLLQCNIDHTIGVACLAHELNKKIYVYSNMSVLPPPYLVDVVDGWSIGYHPSQVDVEVFVARVRELMAMGARGVRVLVEDKEEEKLMPYFRYSTLKTWTRNQCDKTDIEDWYILTQ